MTARTLSQPTPPRAVIEPSSVPSATLSAVPTPATPDEL